MCGYHGYSPEHLCELSLEQRYDDGEADAGRDQVEKSGLWTDRQVDRETDRERQAGGEQVIIQQEASYYRHVILKPDNLHRANTQQDTGQRSDCLLTLFTTLFTHVH